jgi:ribosomal protein L3
MKKIEAQKLDMGQVFSPDGKVVPVTAVSLAELPADFISGTAVKVVGTSKGKGFSGVMKRHGFAGMPATHGRSTKGRAPGSIGGTTTPGRVYRGKKMAGRMGGEQVTVKWLSVVEVDSEKKIAKISGALPGPRLSSLKIFYEPGEIAAENEAQPATEVPPVSEPENPAAASTPKQEPGSVNTKEEKQ